MTGEQQISAAAIFRLMESGPFGVATMAPDRIIGANGAFLRLVGYSEADLAAGLADWRAIALPERTAAERAALDELATGGSCSPFRSEYMRKDGSRVPVEVSAARYFGHRTLAVYVLPCR